MILHGISVLLITSAVGYWVLTHAQKEKGRIKTLGHWLGLAIIVFSVASASCKVYCAVTGSSCPMIGRGMGKACQFTSKSMGYSQPSQ